MEIIGVVAEYNPFHNGHLYHLNKIKELYPQSLIIVVVNGYFMQRGEISVLTKADKTKILSAIGSISFPKSVIILRLRAIAPSKRSVKAAKVKKTKLNILVTKGHTPFPSIEKQIIKTMPPIFTNWRHCFNIFFL